MSIRSSNQSGLASDESVNSDEVYEVLDQVTNKKKCLQGEVKKDKKWDKVEKKEEKKVVILGEHDHSKPLQLQNQKDECYFCLKSVAFETKLKQVTLQKERVVQELLKETKRLQVFQLKHKEKENLVISKQQHNYYLTSFQQIIKSYEQEHRKILKVVGETLKINFNDTKKSLFQIIDSIVTEFMVNFREISLELSCLEEQSCMKAFERDFEQDKGSHGYYSALHKIENIRENVLQLKKTRQ